MKFHRITKPLTALALCALLATAYNVYAKPGFAAQDKVAAEEKAAADTKAAENTDVPADVPATAMTKDETTQAAEDAAVASAVEGDVLKTEDTPAAADDEVMPPMAISTSTALPNEMKPSPDESRLQPNVTQLQTVDLNDTGPSYAYAPPVEQESIPYTEPVGETHPTLNMTPDKSVIVRLDRAAASVLVGNEAHISVLIDTPTTLVVVPRMPGASYFTVLDEERRILMKRHVIVGPAGQYVRVRRSCAGAVATCEHTSVFYCPDGMCHPVNTQQVPSPAPSQSNASTATATGGLGGSNDPIEDTGGEASVEMPTFPNFPFIPVPVPMPGYGDGGDDSSTEE